MYILIQPHMYVCIYECVYIYIYISLTYVNTCVEVYDSKISNGCYLDSRPFFPESSYWPQKIISHRVQHFVSMVFTWMFSPLFAHSSHLHEFHAHLETSRDYEEHFLKNKTPDGILTGTSGICGRSTLVWCTVHMVYPLVNKRSYGKWPLIVSCPIKNWVP